MTLKMEFGMTEPSFFVVQNCASSERTRICDNNNNNNNNTATNVHTFLYCTPRIVAHTHIITYKQINQHEWTNRNTRDNLLETCWYDILTGT